MSRRLTYLVLVVFALLQGLRPLLHAHVGDTGALGDRPHYMHAVDGVSWDGSVTHAHPDHAEPHDSAAIAASDQERRDEQLIPLPPLFGAASDPIPPPEQPRALPNAAPATPVLVGAPSHLLPPALAPPHLA